MLKLLRSFHISSIPRVRKPVNKNLSDIDSPRRQESIVVLKGGSSDFLHSQEINMPPGVDNGKFLFGKAKASPKTRWINSYSFLNNLAMKKHLPLIEYCGDTKKCWSLWLKKDWYFLNVHLKMQFSVKTSWKTTIIFYDDSQLKCNCLWPLLIHFKLFIQSSMLFCILLNHSMPQKH